MQQKETELHDPAEELDELRSRTKHLESIMVPLAKRTAKAEWQLVKTQAELDRYRLRKGMRLLDATIDFTRRPTRPLIFLKRAGLALRPLPKPEIPSDKPKPEDIFAEAEIISKLKSASDNSDLPYPGIRLGFLGEFPFTSVCRGVDLAHVNWEEAFDIGIDAILVNHPNLDNLAHTILKQAARLKIPIVDWQDNTDFLKTKTVKKITNEPPLTKAGNSSKFYLPPGVDIHTYNPVNWHRTTKNTILCLAECNPLAAYEAEKNILLKPLTKKVTISGHIRLDDFPYNHGAAKLEISESVINSKRNLAAVCLPSLFPTTQKFISRVLEFMAVGTPVITIDSPALTKAVDKKYLLLSSSAAQTKKYIKQLSNVEFRERHSIAARRYVHLHHCQQTRLEQLLKLLGLPINPPAKISIIMCTNRPTHLSKALQNVTSQNYPSKELILVLHGDNFDISKVKRLVKASKLTTKLIQQPSSTLFGEALNAGLDASTGTFVTKMDDDDVYGPNHLLDLIVALRYSGAEMVGKWSNFVYLEKMAKTISWVVEREERFGNHLPGATIFMRRDFLTKYRFGRVRRAIDSELRDRVIADGGQLYSTHRYNFVRVRHDSHTYKAYQPGDFLVKSSGKKYRGLDHKDVFV